MRQAFPTVLAVFVLAFPLAGWSEDVQNDIERLVSSLNRQSPFVSDKIELVKTTTRLVDRAEEQDDWLGTRVVKARAVIDMHFAFLADFDPKTNRLTRIRPDHSQPGEQKHPRSDLAEAVKKLLRGRCRSVRVRATRRDSRRDVRIRGSASFVARVAYLARSKRLVFYQRPSALAGLWDREVDLSEQQILEIYHRCCKDLIPLPEDAKLDRAWMSDVPIDDLELVRVAEVRFKRKNATKQDFILFQFNPLSKELVRHDRKWSGER